MKKTCVTAEAFMCMFHKSSQAEEFTAEKMREISKFKKATELFLEHKDMITEKIIEAANEGKMDLVIRLHNLPHAGHAVHLSDYFKAKGFCVNMFEKNNYSEVQYYISWGV